MHRAPRPATWRAGCGRVRGEDGTAVLTTRTQTHPWLVRHTPGVGAPGPSYGRPQKEQADCRHCAQVSTTELHASGSSVASGATRLGDRELASRKLAARMNSDSAVPDPEMMSSRRRPMRSMRKKPMSTPVVAHAPMLTMACAMASSLAKPAMPMISML
jgi:hypothetical protein